MKLTFCGTGAGLYTAERASSGIMLEHDGRLVMLDCGPGTLREALRAGIDLRRIEAVLVSHIHLDHVQDLAAFFVRCTFEGRRLPAVFGPPGVDAHLRAAADYTRTVTELAARTRPADLFEADVTEIDGSDEREVGGFAMRSEDTPHAPGVRAAVRRLTAGGMGVVYSGDTVPNPEALVPLARGADVLVHECYTEAGIERTAKGLTPERAERMQRVFPTTHTELRHAAAIAAAAGVRTLVLTHLLRGESPDELVAEVRRQFSGEIIVARDGLTLKVAPPGGGW